jgi:hypothetical protein
MNIDPVTAVTTAVLAVLTHAGKLLIDRLAAYFSKKCATGPGFKKPPIPMRRCTKKRRT